MTPDLLRAAGLFLVSSAAIIAAAMFLARSSDVIAYRTGLGRLWAGSLLLAAATSLPELVTVVSAVRIGAPAIALGDVFGANMLNVSNLAILATLLGTRDFYKGIHTRQVWVAVLAVVLILIALLPALYYPGVEVLGFTPFSIAILGTYIVASRFITRGSNAPDDGTAPTEEPHGLPSLRWGWTVFLLCALGIFVTAPLLASSTQQIAHLSGLGESFLGVIAVAIVTTLPELVATATAIRMGAADLAIGGMFGSNAFNVAMLAVSDPLTPGEVSVFAGLNESSIAAGLFAALLGVLGVIQLASRAPATWFSLTRVSVSLLSAVWLVGILTVFWLGG